MDFFLSYNSDPIPISSGSNNCYLADPGQAASPSLSDGSSRACRASFSDDDLMLASNCPKRRAGRKKFRETRHPVYRGIRRRDSGKWVCEVREPNKESRIWLGTFPTADMAARAHDVAAIALRGKSACLNFADSAWRLPIPASTNAKDIQKAAAEAAQAFRTSECEGVSGDDAKEESSKNTTPMPENVFLTDEDAVFGMPGLLENMAEAMMLPPPQYVGEDDVEAHADVYLWSFSI